MHADQRVNSLNMLWTGGGVITLKIWVCATVHCLSAVDNLPELGGKFLVSSIA
jgi:hypothetical protein